jgi:predicted nucleic acid-binding Zn ribbon protein
MYVSYDYKCQWCNITQNRFIDKKEKDNQTCKRCNAPMLKLPPATKTTFKFNDK